MAPFDFVPTPEAVCWAGTRPPPAPGQVHQPLTIKAVSCRGPSHTLTRSPHPKAALTASSSPPPPGAATPHSNPIPLLRLPDHVTVLCNGVRGVLLITSQTILCRCTVCNQPDLPLRVLTPAEFQRHSAGGSSSAGSDPRSLNTPAVLAGQQGACIAASAWHRTVKLDGLGDASQLPRLSGWLADNGFPLREDADLEASQQGVNSRLASARSACRAAALLSPLQRPMPPLAGEPQVAAGPAFLAPPLPIGARDGWPMHQGASTELGLQGPALHTPYQGSAAAHKGHSQEPRPALAREMPPPPARPRPQQLLMGLPPARPQVAWRLHSSASPTLGRWDEPASRDSRLLLRHVDEEDTAYPAPPWGGKGSWASQGAAPCAGPRLCVGGADDAEAGREEVGGGAAVLPGTVDALDLLAGAAAAQAACNTGGEGIVKLAGRPCNTTTAEVERQRAGAADTPVGSALRRAFRRGWESWATGGAATSDHAPPPSGAGWGGKGLRGDGGARWAEEQGATQVRHRGPRSSSTGGPFHASSSSSPPAERWPAGWSQDGGGGGGDLRWRPAPRGETAAAAAAAATLPRGARKRRPPTWLVQGGFEGGAAGAGGAEEEEEEDEKGGEDGRPPCKVAARAPVVGTGLCWGVRARAPQAARGDDGGGGGAGVMSVGG